MSKVLFCTAAYFPDKTGGAEHQARLQAEELVRRGHQVVVVCPRARGARSGDIGGISVHRLPVIQRRAVHSLSYCLVLTFFLAWHIRRFELLHIHMALLDSVVICFLARLFSRPVYAKIASGGPQGDARFLARRWYSRRFVLGYAHFQAISDEIASDLLTLGVSPDRVASIANGVDMRGVQTLSPVEKSALRVRLGLPLDQALVLFLGRFVAIKGLDVLLAAWAALPNDGAALVLVGRRPGDAVPVRGNGESGSSLPAADELVHDWTDKPVDYIRAVDIFVLPSRTEGMSNALLMAMANGLPVIATRVGAAEAMIEDGVSGFLIQVDDADQLQLEMQKLINDPDLRASMGSAARSRVSELFSIESVVDRIEAEYREILRKKR